MTCLSSRHERARSSETSRQESTSCSSTRHAPDASRRYECACSRCSTRSSASCTSRATPSRKRATSPPSRPSFLRSSSRRCWYSTTFPTRATPRASWCSPSDRHPAIRPQTPVPTVWNESASDNYKRGTTAGWQENRAKKHNLVCQLELHVPSELSWLACPVLPCTPALSPPPPHR